MAQKAGLENCSEKTRVFRFCKRKKHLKNSEVEVLDFVFYISCSIYYVSYLIPWWSSSQHDFRHGVYGCSSWVVMLYPVFFVAYTKI